MSITSALALLLPEAYCLKREENYVLQREKIINIAKLNSLIKYIYKKGKAPEEVDEFANIINKKKLEIQQAWEKGNALIKLLITNNYKALLAQITSACTKSA